MIRLRLSEQVSLSTAEINHLIAQGTNSLARLAFAACPPGQSPSDAQVQLLFPASHVAGQGALNSLKRLIFEAQTLVVADVKQTMSRKEENQTVVLAPAERENRIKDQRTRLSGLRFRGDEEVAHQCYDTVLSMMEKDALTYLGPEKFVARRFELLQKRPGREIAIDASSLVVKDRSQQLTCPTSTELYDKMNVYHSELIDHLTQMPPPGYSRVSVHQVLRGDRAAFLYMAEKLTALKRDALNQSPLEKLLESVLSHSSVSFRLLPLAKQPESKRKSDRSRKRDSASFREFSGSPPRPVRQRVRKGKGKGKSNRKGPRVPENLVGEAFEMLGVQPKWLFRCSTWSGL